MLTLKLALRTFNLFIVYILLIEIDNLEQCSQLLSELLVSLELHNQISQGTSGSIFKYKIASINNYKHRIFLRAIQSRLAQWEKFIETL